MKKKKNNKMDLIFNLRNSYVLLLCLFVLHFYQVNAQPKIFDLNNYGGVASNTFDNSKALLCAWNEACKSEGGGQVLIPNGTYLVSSVELIGPCKGPIEFHNTGVILGPPGLTKLGHVINFRYLDKLTISGGIYDGQGPTAWAQSDELDSGHTLLCLAFVNNSNICGVNLTNSKKVHLGIFGCNNLEMSKVTILAPDESPNTDGIKLAVSSNIKILDSNIASGDDCIAILNGTNNLNVNGVRCGPGHGISIGSMGGTPDLPGDEVRNISVTNCTFIKTLNGLRIKSWAKPNEGICSCISFENIIMEEANNPVVIDQNYCPARNCLEGDSKVKIDGVNFINISGTSASRAAINLNCSKINPCENVKLENINLNYTGPEGPTAIICNNVKGTATGVQIPGTCIL